jgi:rhodanese-related sulfurtransferase
MRFIAFGTSAQGSLFIADAHRVYEHLFSYRIVSNWRNQLGLLSPEKTIVLIDHKGKLTLTTGRFLSTNGFHDVLRLHGGFNDWVKSGLPVVKSDVIISSKE